MWVQSYDPIGWWAASTFAAALPVIVLLGLLVSGRANAWQAALAGLITALGMALTVFGMPMSAAFGAVGTGLVFATFRIAWLVLSAVFLYDIVVRTGQFAVMRASVARISEDRRIQAVLVAFCFGAFIEGIAGFGAPVAISAAFLAGLGFPPLLAAVLCLVANTAPVAWGSIGVPIKTLAAVTGLDVEDLSVTAGRILPPISFIVPIWLIGMMVPFRRVVEILPALVVIGGSFAVTQWFWSNHVGVDLVDLASAGVSLAAGVLFLRFWKPRRVYLFEGDAERAAERGAGALTDDDRTAATGPLTARKVAKAWAPFGILAVIVTLWGIPAIKTRLDAATTFRPEMPGLHNRVAKGEAIGGHVPPQPSDLIEAKLDVAWFSATGTAVFLSACLSSLFLGLRPGETARILAGTFVRLIPALGAIYAMLALGFLTRYSGMDAVMGLAFTRVGPELYPIFGALLGWLGVALTGSDTASNVLFGNLQVITAEKLDLNPILMASANSTGGVMGKMIDAQSIVVAAAATGEHGREGEILRRVFWHSVSLALIVGLVVWAYARHFPEWVPSPPPAPFEVFVRSWP